MILICVYYRCHVSDYVWLSVCICDVMCLYVCVCVWRVLYVSNCTNEAPIYTHSIVDT